jgi:hypothetical protein
MQDQLIVFKGSVRMFVSLIFSETSSSSPVSRAHNGLFPNFLRCTLRYPVFNERLRLRPSAGNIATRGADRDKKFLPLEYHRPLDGFHEPVHDAEQLLAAADLFNSRINLIAANLAAVSPSRTARASIRAISPEAGRQICPMVSFTALKESGL